MNRKPQGTGIKYIDPKEVSQQDYLLCTNHDQFLMSTHFTRVPMKDNPNCDRVFYFIKRQALYARLEGGEGYVYILQCDNQPGICKIGQTERTPQERVREINAGTGVIFPWYLVAAFACKSPRAVEQLVHLELDKYRINSKKEGFSIFPDQAREVIERVIQKYGAELEGTPQTLKQKKEYWFDEAES